jgi:hypothetical protein
MRRPVGVKWVLSLFCGTRFFLPPSNHCRHASIRTLEERIVSLGACWAFSFQPVLPSVWRPWVLLFASPTWARRLTQSPETRLFDFPFPEMFLFYAASANELCWLLCSGSYASPLTHK